MLASWAGVESWRRVGLAIYDAQYRSDGFLHNSRQHCGADVPNHISDPVLPRPGYIDAPNEIQRWLLPRNTAYHVGRVDI